MILKSFYARLSLLFLLLILFLGGISLVITFNASSHLFDEVEQVLNRDYAQSIAKELEPLVADGFSEEKIKKAIHYIMVLNPKVEIYIVENQGGILCYFTDSNETLARERIDIDPVESFIRNRGLEPIQGDDPFSRKEKKPFSAATLKLDDDLGYVYVILRGRGFDRSLDSLRNNYYARSALITFSVAIAATLIAGLGLFFLLTRRLTLLSSAVKAFEQGEYKQRIPAAGQDELGVLCRGFNDMAESIESGVEQLHLAEQQRKDLIANISHDLRSPITSIRGSLETLLIKDESLSEKERREFLEIGIKNVSSFQQLVEELFDLAKLEARQVTPQMMDFSMAELVQDVVLKLKALAVQMKIEFRLTPPDEMHTVRGDIALLERVLTNILENALGHTPAGGEIFIELGRSELMQTVTIEDTGIGIAEEDLPHLFERFYKADKSRNRETPGTGLGLAIAREIVELHSGRIEAESPAGRGAVFRIFIPGKN
ncbi:MAG: HAMP domain-containing sensor histidine kinase [Spirochaetales bacterium]|nr:HAMP domain-containing sensor histidine kinase [Spirochaetales bacterium]